MKEFVIYGSKYNLKLTKVCKRCNGYRRFQNERRKEVSIKKNGTDEEICLAKASDNR